MLLLVIYILADKGILESPCLAKSQGLQRICRKNNLCKYKVYCIWSINVGKRIFEIYETLSV
jgi:hypothetical protein